MMLLPLVHSKSHRLSGYELQCSDPDYASLSLFTWSRLRRPRTTSYVARSYVKAIPSPDEVVRENTPATYTSILAHSLVARFILGQTSPEQLVALSSKLSLPEALANLVLTTPTPRVAFLDLNPLNCQRHNLVILGVAATAMANFVDSDEADTITDGELSSPDPDQSSYSDLLNRMKGQDDDK